MPGAIQKETILSILLVRLRISTAGGGETSVTVFTFDCAASCGKPEDRQLCPKTSKPVSDDNTPLLFTFLNLWM